MSIYSAVASAPRVLLEVDLRPIQGTRFQPTGFPDLGPALFRTPDGTDRLLVESAQSVANHLETVCWDDGANALVEALQGMPYVESRVADGVTTNSLQEAHRLNSPYLFHSEGYKAIVDAVGFEKDKPFDRRRLAAALLAFDPASLLHGTFIEKIGGTVRLPRALSGFIEAFDVSEAHHGGVKVDRIQPASTGDSTAYGKASEGYGNVPYHRSDFTGRITAYFNLDLHLLRQLGLSPEAVRFLFALALFKIDRFLSHGLRLRTACDLEVDTAEGRGLRVTRPDTLTWPTAEAIEAEVRESLQAASNSFASPAVTTLTYQKGFKPC